MTTSNSAVMWAIWMSTSLILGREGDWQGVEGILQFLFMCVFFLEGHYLSDFVTCLNGCSFYGLALNMGSQSHVISLVGLAFNDRVLLDTR